MARSDVDHTLSTQSSVRHVDVAYLPSAYARSSGDPMRAMDFWIGHHQYEPPTDTDALALHNAMLAQRVGALAQLVPDLKGLARDPRPSVRATFATCFSILAKANQAPADRDVWRALLGLAKYDDDPDVRRVAERALEHFEYCGTYAKAS